MKKFISVLIGILFFQSLCIAQEDILYTQYIFSQLSVNPAYAGNNIDLNITALSRKQWIGLDGSPTSVSLFADGTVLGGNPRKERNTHKDRKVPLFSNNKKLGIGLILFNEKVGVNNTFHAKTAYSYKINFSADTRLSFGLQAGIMSFKQSFDKLENIESNDEIFQDNINLVRFNIGSGVFFETQHYFMGFSVPSIIKSSLEPKEKTGESQLRQYFFSAGYLFYLNPHFKLKPTIMVRHTEELPTQFDLNVHLLYNDRIWGGISYRYKSSINISTKILITQSLNVGFAYDFAIGAIRNINTGSAEILISYLFRQPKKRIINPRYF
jgi:type IX secretion system PorP/SprF family membrane protein